ncbi:MAG TPA: 4Fe-4S dicluster domain-containing protein [candidate division WOR-3 bacterium]|uniref:4Fe-4S dicluster domain-containing protein n=1 Tax=candidate division WOR-3 bacterium TaxID=2052148 RepID=A0A9C9K088_UNCW3|nr:4Fe-4S dicluster domain-containing protein [candidate division WOR-3 bacterium]
MDEKEIEHWITISILGRKYKVPAGLTIMQAMEFAGYRFIRSCGCRAGFCGACTTVYRIEGDYRLKTAMACQTRVEDGMYLTQIPFTPAERANYDINKLSAGIEAFLTHYPEILRCLGCNSCTKACPQDIDVMEYIAAGKRGDISLMADLSFDCIMCGLCAMRCPAELAQYNYAQLARRLHGKYETPPPDHLLNRVKEIEEGKYKEELDKLMSTSTDELKKLYTSRDIEKA